MPKHLPDDVLAIAGVEMSCKRDENSVQLKELKLITAF
jgi:hypothetical protein